MILRIAIVLLACVSPVFGADVLDDFDDVHGWRIIAADGVKGEIVEVDGTLRLDYDFTAGAGYCVLHKDIELSIDPNYRFAFDLKGSGPRNTLEFKLIDESGENVWWSVRRGIEFPRRWTPFLIRRRHVSFAWGPSGGTALSRVGAIEIAVTAVEGGKGSISLDNLIYERLPDVEPTPTEPIVRTSADKQIARVAPDGAFGWSSSTDSELRFVFDAAVEFSGIEITWADDRAPGSYTLAASTDGEDFDRIARVRDSDGGTDLVFAPETEASVVVLETVGEAAIESIRFLPVEELTDANDYFAWIAERAPRGAFPEYFDELSAWTVVGLPSSEDEALVSATGSIEPRKAWYTLEPFVVMDNQLLSWSDATISHTLADGSLPIPSVHWVLDGLELDITAVATESRRHKHLVSRYALTNTSDTDQQLTLALAARPLQVLPAAQFLNTVGGAVDSVQVDMNKRSIRVDAALFAYTSANADAMVVADAPSGLLVDRIMDPERRSDRFAQRSGDFPSGALLFDVTLRPGESWSVDASMPMNEQAAMRMRETVLFDMDQILLTERARWDQLLSQTTVLVPESAQHLQGVIDANLAYILINADGAGIQPGSRTYERSWIRDGAMTSAALIALGRTDEARAFIEWYSDYQYDNGKIPCVVDARGPDPVDEHDAPGEFIFAIRNIAEAGGGFDQQFARAMYPRVRATVDYIESLRAMRLTAGYTESSDPITRASIGLVPESISHEGYSEKPMHSYWDDFWIYRGLHDAVRIAELLGEDADSERFAQLAADFGGSLRASVDAAAAHHGIDYVPGCVELGDFDATSTAIAYYPTGAAEVLDKELLESTFERAWMETRVRIDGSEWDGMTPYEVRTVGTFVRLGWIDRAHRYMDWLMERQDPIGWRQWGEIAYRERAPARFVGDMPHTWVGSGAILSILSMFAYEDGDAIVLAAGVPSDWLADPKQPIGVNGQVTRFGTLSYRLTRSSGELVLDIEQGCAPPDGYRIDLQRLLGDGSDSGSARELAIWIDGERQRADGAGVLALPMGTSSVVVRDSEAEED